jgi:citrate synthase
MERMLETEEAARRLGIKVPTLYAYVSRGLVASHRAPGGRRSLFDADDVERLARRSRQGKTTDTRMATITTAITQLTEVGPVYRGRPAVELALRASFEEVATLLWAVPEDVPEGDEPWIALPLGAPPVAAGSDRMRWATVLAGADDPLRADLRPEAVVRAARRLVATTVASLAGGVPAAPVPLELADGRVLADAVAARLTAAICPTPDREIVRAVNAALVLLADHELATSTMAVRVAASTRADPYDAVLAGLATIAGPLHGGASQRARTLLDEAARVGVEQALGDTLRWQGVLHGFGHPVYKDGDPRYDVLWSLFEQLAPADEVAIVSSLVALAADRAVPPPNVDLAIAAITRSAGMGADAGQTVFSVARMAGWIAHYLEELEERPLRYRARAVYARPTRR